MLAKVILCVCLNLGEINFYCIPSPECLVIRIMKLYLQKDDLSHNYRRQAQKCEMWSFLSYTVEKNCRKKYKKCVKYNFCEVKLSLTFKSHREIIRGQL